MKTKPVPSPTPEQTAPMAPLASYLAEFEQWIRKSTCCQGNEAEDIRLASWELRDVPVTRDDARRVFLRLASRFECRMRGRVFGQGALVEQPEEFAAVADCDAVRSLALFNALEKLGEHERWLVKECKIEERSHAEVAKQCGVGDETVRHRLWQAMTKLIAMCKNEEKKRGKNQKAFALIAPLAFEFTETQRAAFSAIWKAEGRIPTFGGGPPDPPGPPVTPAAPLISATPVTAAPVGSAVSAVTMAIVVGMLILVPTSTVGIYYFWDPPLAQTANKGLRTPPVSVFPMDFAPLQTPTPSSTKLFDPSNNTKSSSPPAGPKELERVRRYQAPRFLRSP